MIHASTGEGYARLLRLAILVQTLLFAFFVAGSHNAFTHLPRPTTTDFSSFYAAGLMADRGQAASAYDPARHGAVEAQVTAPGIVFHDFLNPPPFLLICAPLAALPYLLAFVLFELVTLALFLWVGCRIAGGGRLARLSLLAVPSVYWALGWGQNSFLTASLMGLGTLLLDSRPGLAGAAFGGLAIKPHFGILIPVALLCGRRWRAMLGAAAALTALAGLSTALFGVGAWRGFLGALSHTGSVPLVGRIDLRGAAELLGASAAQGWVIQGIASLVALGVVGWLWLTPPGRGTGGREARMAALVAGTLVAMPFLLFYDLVMASLAAAWIAGAARRSGWLPGERRWGAVLFAIVLLDFPAASFLHLAIGCLAGPILLGFAVRRARHAAPGL